MPRESALGSHVQAVAVFVSQLNLGQIIVSEVLDFGVAEVHHEVSRTGIAELP
jgi:hypothetical protein